MNYILSDYNRRNALLPFTFTRPVAEIRIGILTIKEKWELALSAKVSFKTENYLQDKFPLKTGSDNILINSTLLPDSSVINAISELKPNQKLIFKNQFMACRIDDFEMLNQDIEFEKLDSVNFQSMMSEPVFLNNIWDIFTMNDAAIRSDFVLLTQGRKSSPVYAPNQLSGLENIFVEEGAKVYASILNATSGPIYIAKDAEVMDGCMIRGPFALGEHATLKMGTKIYGATTIGPHCKVGGELSNSVFFGYSNKAHDGFIGNSVIGEWCNLGADTNNSNLKNNYSNVKIWSFEQKMMIDTGLQFCGLFMGDHSKCSINTMFNTGTVTGVSANIYGGDFPAKYIPSFGWGGARGFDRFQLSKAIELAEKVYERRAMKFDDTDKKIFEHLFKNET